MYILPANYLLFLLVVFSIYPMVCISQHPEELPLELQEVSYEGLRISKEGKKPYYCDALDFVADEQNFHVLFTDGRKLYYSLSTNKGRIWETELVAYIDNEENQDPNIRIRVGDRGTVHLFFPELESEETTIWHYSRPRHSLGWSKEIIFRGTHPPKSRFVMDVDVDCNNHLFVVYNIGDGELRYSFSEWQKWQHEILPYGNAHSGCAIVSGFDQNVFIAIANDQGDLKLASKKIKGGRWTLEQVTGPVFGECDITLISDGGLLVTSSAATAGADKNYQISIRKPDNSWSTKQLAPLQNYALHRGGIKNINAYTDPSGRIHLTHYFTNYSAPANKSLAHIYSNDRARTWKAEIISENINGYVGKYAPALSWSDNFVYIAAKDTNHIPLIHKIRSDRNLKEFARCLYRRNPLHENVDYQRDTTSRIVDVPLRKPDPLPKHKPRITSNPDNRSTVRQGTFTTSDSTIKVIVQDYQDIDGDTVSIFFNNSCILYRYALTAFSHVVEVKIDPEKEQLLRLYAESEGSKPPCTVSLFLRDSRRTQKYVIKSNLKENGAIVLNPDR